MSSEDTELITIPAGAKYLGISETLLYRAVANDKLPYQRIGRYTFVTRDALDRWFADPETHRLGPPPKNRRK